MNAAILHMDKDELSPILRADRNYEGEHGILVVYDPETRFRLKELVKLTAKFETD
jgi:hypothetical protein